MSKIAQNSFMRTQRQKMNIPLTAAKILQISLVEENTKVIIIKNDIEKLICLESCLLSVNSDNDYIQIKLTRHHISSARTNTRLHTNHTLIIHENFYSCGSIFFLCERSAKVEIGQGCTFLSTINGKHLIDDKETDKCISVPSYSVSIGNSVGVGHRVQSLENASIVGNSPIASVVTK